MVGVVTKQYTTREKAKTIGKKNKVISFRKLLYAEFQVITIIKTSRTSKTAKLIFVHRVVFQGFLLRFKPVNNRCITEHVYRYVYSSFPTND